MSEHPEVPSKSKRGRFTSECWLRIRAALAFIVAVSCIASACSDRALDQPGTVDARDLAAPLDQLAGDAALPAADLNSIFGTEPLPCGSQTCAVGQVCCVPGPESTDNPEPYCADGCLGINTIVACDSDDDCASHACCMTSGLIECYPEGCDTATSDGQPPFTQACRTSADCVGFLGSAFEDMTWINVPFDHCCAYGAYRAFSICAPADYPESNPGYTCD